MRTYITKPKSIKKSLILDKGFSLSGKDYRFLKNNSKAKYISEYIEKDFSGKEIGSEAYMQKSRFRFLKTVNLGNNFTLETTKFEYCKPINKVYPKKGDILIAKDGGGNGLGEIALYNLDNENKLDSISAGILGVRLNEEIKYYILGLLKTRHFKEFVDLNTPQGSTIRHSKKVALDYKIPFPTTKNHEEPQKVQDLVSILVQNIIDKEEQIKAKNQKIDDLIEKELMENQNSKSFHYKLPRISEIKKEGRLDTGLYEKKIKEVEGLILNYLDGYFKISELSYKFVSGSTPESYIYTNKDNALWWIAVADINYGLTYSKQVKIQVPSIINNILINGDILITRKGATLGKMNLYFATNILAFVNEDIKVLRLKTKLYQKIFVGLFLNSKYGQTKLISSGSKGTKQGLTNENILSTLIPSFPELKQQEIAREYYNQIEKNSNLKLENYVELEKIRNSQLGIFQLNMEIFELREKLEELVDKIVNEEVIEIVF